MDMSQCFAQLLLINTKEICAGVMRLLPYLNEVQILITTGANLSV